MKALAEIMADVRAQLAWVGPNGKQQGHIALVRAEMELLIAALEAHLENPINHVRAGIVGYASDSPDLGLHADQLPASTPSTAG